MEIFVETIGSSSAPRRSLDSLADQLGSGSVGLLEAGGFSQFEVADVDIAALAHSAVADCFAGGMTRPEDIRALFLVSESLGQFDPPPPGEASLHAPYRSQWLEHLIKASHLTQARPFGLWGSACGNLIPAFNLAAPMAGAGPLLILAADQLAPGAPRARGSGAALFGDTAAACILSADRSRASFVINAIATVPVFEILANERQDDFVKSAELMVSGLQRLETDLMAAKGMSLAAYDLVVFESFNQAMVAFLSRKLGLSAKQVKVPARSDYGHAFSADLLLALRELAQERLTEGTSLAVISASSWHLSAMGLRVCNPAKAGT